MDIQMELRQDAPEASLVSLFTFVARDTVSLQAAPINPLQPGTSEQVQLFNERQNVADSRRLARLEQKQGKALGSFLCLYTRQLCF
jgi:acyl-coenzyme A thioesterase 9